MLGLKDVPLLFSSRDVQCRGSKLVAFFGGFENSLPKLKVSSLHVYPKVLTKFVGLQ